MCLKASVAPLEGALFLRENGGRFWIAPDVAATFARHRQLSRWRREAGGVILGRWILDTEDVVVDVVSEPGRGDRRGRFFFHRERERAQAIVDDAWQSSLNSRVYLGEWHTHPQDVPSPSSADVDDWRRIAHGAIYESQALFFIIVGRSALRAWQFSTDKGLGILHSSPSPLIDRVVATSR